MLTNVFRKVFNILSIFILAGCINVGGGAEVEEYVLEFYRGDRLTVDDRITQYPIDQQWVIYKYGTSNSRTEIAPLDGISRAGYPMLLYILNEIKTTKYDIDVLHAIVIATYMQKSKYYLVCNDSVVLNEIIQNKNRMYENFGSIIYQNNIDALLQECK